MTRRIVLGVVAALANVAVLVAVFVAGVSFRGFGKANLVQVGDQKAGRTETEWFAIEPPIAEGGEKASARCFFAVESGLFRKQFSIVLRADDPSLWHWNSATKNGMLIEGKTAKVLLDTDHAESREPGKRVTTVSASGAIEVLVLIASGDARSIKFDGKSVPIPAQGVALARELMLKASDVKQ